MSGSCFAPWTHRCDGRRPTDNRSLKGYTGERAAEDAAAHGIRLEVVELPDAKRRFVLHPKRWVAERSNGWRAAAAWLATMNAGTRPCAACMPAASPASRSLDSSPY